MKKLKKLRLKDLKQQAILLSKEEQAGFIGGDSTYEGGWLPEVYCYTEAIHTGNITTCPICSEKLQSIISLYDWGDWRGFKGIFYSGLTLYAELYCLSNYLYYIYENDEE